MATAANLAGPPESFKLALNPFLARKDRDEDVNCQTAPVKEGFVLVHPDVPEVVSICMKVVWRRAKSQKKSLQAAANQRLIGLQAVVSRRLLRCTF